jgi:hypothetical protein
MNEIEYLRAQAKMLCELAKTQRDAEIIRELLALALRCEQLANHMQGNGAAPPGGG